MDNRPSPAKITRPRASDTFSRTRLIQQLDRARRRPLLWIMGPPGAGKTMLVADYLERRRLASLWYQADAGDGDIATFFHYLGMAAQKAAPQRRKPLPLFSPDGAPNLGQFARQFFQELYARIRPPFAIILDNYQDIPSGAALHDILPYAVEALPDKGHVLIISRGEPPASLARLRLHDAMSMLDDRALRLTLSETQGIARRRLPDVKSRARVATLHEMTQGWTAGVVLMLEQSGSAPLSDTSPTGTPGVLFEYFAAEVFGKADPDTQAVLLKSVFLPSMTARMVAELSGERRAGRILNHLSRNNFFTQRFALHEPVYQYHPLFREFLLSRAARHHSPDELNEVRRHAAQLLEDSGAEEAALSLYQECRDWRSMERVLIRIAPLLMTQGRNHALEQWLNKLPPDRFEQSPWLLYWLATVRLNQNSADGRLLFERAIGKFRVTGDAPGARLAWCQAVNSILQEHAGFNALRDWIAAFATLPTATADAHSDAQIAVSMLSALVLVQPGHPEIDIWSERAFAVLQSDAEPNTRIAAGTSLLMRHALAGEPARAMPIRRLLEGMLHLTSVTPLARLTGQTSMALCQWLAGTPSDALTTIADALRLAEATGMNQCNSQLFEHAAAASLTAGNLEAAEEWLDRLASTASPLRLYDAGYKHYLACWMALQRGDLPVALEHLALSEKLGREFGLWFVDAALWHARAAILLQTGQPVGAAEPIAKLHALAQAGRSQLFGFMAHLLDAQRALEEGREVQALDALARAMRLGRQQRLTNTYCWLPRVMARLCAKALEAGIETDYVRELIQQRALPPSEDARDLEVWPWPVKIYTLGRLSIVSNEQPLAFSGKAQSRPLELLQTLIALGGRGVPEESLSEILWPDAEGDAAHRAFDTTLHRLRRLLGSERALLLSDGKLSLNPAVCWVDVWAFERLLGRLDALIKQPLAADTASSPVIARLASRLAALYRGPFLGGETSAAPAIAPRERLVSKFLCLLGTLGRYWEAAGEWSSAAETYQKAIDVSNLAEENYQRLMLVYRALGHHSEALSVYQRCRETLHAAQGRPPSPGIEALRRELETAR